MKYEVSLPSSSSQKGSNGPSSTDNKDTDPSKTGFSLDDLMNSIPTDFWNLIGLNKAPTSSDNGSKDADFTPVSHRSNNQQARALNQLLLAQLPRHLLLLHWKLLPLRNHQKIVNLLHLPTKKTGAFSSV